MEYANQPAPMQHRPYRPTRGMRACVAAGSVLALFALLTLPDASDARQAAGHLTVGATVQSYVQLKASNPTQFIVLNKDSNQGYVSIPNASNPAGTQITVTTNDRTGYSLVFQVAPAMQSMFTSIEVSGLGTTVVLPATGGKVTLPYAGLNTRFTLTWRFTLAKKAKDGTYTWPVSIVAQPN